MVKMDNDIIIKPIITEKAMESISQKKYTFRVADSATKIEIAKACESLFHVTVKKVNTVHVKGHLKRQGAAQGYRPDWKKAIVTLTEDSNTIEFFEGMM